MNAKTNLFSIKTTFNCKGRLLDLSTPVVMGIINATPDSFYDGGKYSTEDQILFRVENMIHEGACIIDIGGQSTSPGAERVSIEEELKRVISPIQKIRNKFPDIFISIDTFYDDIAQKALDSGADIINDISAFQIDKQLLQVVAKNKSPYILMHMQGEPQSMQLNPQYNSVSYDVIQFLKDKIFELNAVGLNDIIIDPGFGFGKSRQHNFSLLKHMDDFKILGYPVLAGISRKSMVNKTLNIKAVDALNGTTALNMLALQNGAKILRVHDVLEAIQCIVLWNEYDNAI